MQSNSQTVNITNNIHVSYKELLSIFLILALVTYPLFFDIYRGAVFDIVPHDHYEYYAFYLLDYSLGKLPPETHAYRILAVIFVLPFYYIVPLISFSGLDNVALDESYLKMLIAFSLVTYLAMMATCMIAYLTARKRFGASVPLALIVLLMTYLMLHHLREGLYGVDALGVMMVSLVIYHMQNKSLYALLIIVGVLVNEKVAMIFFMVMAGRWLLYRPRQFDIYLMAPVIALMLYAVINMVAPSYFHFSTGTEDHRNILNFLSQFAETLMLSFSMKGIVLNVLPVVILFGLYFLAMMSTRYMDTGVYFKSSDALALVGLLLIIHAINVDYNVGRIAMYVFPLYLPLACMTLYQWFPAEYKLMEQQAKNA